MQSVQIQAWRGPSAGVIVTVKRVCKLESPNETLLSLTSLNVIYHTITQRMRKHRSAIFTAIQISLSEGQQLISGAGKCISYCGRQNLIVKT